VVDMTGTWLQSSSSWRSIQTVWRRCWTDQTRSVRLLAWRTDGRAIAY